MVASCRPQQTGAKRANKKGVSRCVLRAAAV
jgi:hypothetical protein